MRRILLILYFLMIIFISGCVTNSGEKAVERTESSSHSGCH